MHTFADLARTLNRPAVYLRGLQTRFGLPVLEGAGYSGSYLAFLRTLVFLRTFGVSEDALLKAWHLETKLLTLLHVDSTGSPTWFLDACGQTTHRKRRLLLTNYDLGVVIPSRMVQLGLDFGDVPPELFAGKEMGEDALRVLEEIITASAGLRRAVADEMPQVRAALTWANVCCAGDALTDDAGSARAAGAARLAEPTLHGGSTALSRPRSNESGETGPALP